MYNISLLTVELYQYLLGLAFTHIYTYNTKVAHRLKKVISEYSKDLSFCLFWQISVAYNS